ncbi:rhodanese-like domain-containing protein [Glaciecola petra]|uniref:Rhodanese-like domain-containing protein n=1 Tax=Glaciecola petra TaxID=3075602 RepID=A0ABU2ZUB8_9ALTE|nr:rhodanese-like domain-containing protein [Aestuariibacter sp. P117]MDT0596232.1 rhodanese-like domain-containing protein [Aestuariibacter sp. P117]
MSAINTIDAAEAKQLHNSSATFIDVREPAEHNTKHIPSSALMPLGKISAADLEINGAENIVIYCQKGMRGNKACEKLLQQNPALKLHNLAGGIEAWEAANFEVTKGSSSVLPLDRQVQIAIGTLVLCFSLLAHFYSANFNFAAAFVGAGLLFAGLSGFCGLARLIAMAPWNK